MIGEYVHPVTAVFNVLAWMVGSALFVAFVVAVGLFLFLWLGEPAPQPYIDPTPTTNTT